MKRRMSKWDRNKRNMKVESDRRWGVERLDLVTVNMGGVSLAVCSPAPC